MKALRILVIVCTAAVLVTGTGCTIPPAMRLERVGPAVIVHVETLGEYPTTVRHIQIRDASSAKVVFEVLAQNGTPQIYSIRLSAGENSTHVADPEQGSYRVVAPTGTNTFLLQQGVQYRLTIWGSGLLSRESDFKF